MAGTHAARPRCVAGLLAALVLAACATPAARIDARAAASGFAREVIAGERYRHLVYFRAGAPHRPLHVYIEHDGSPWVGEVRVAGDPTPRRPLMLELMAHDAAPALYLGRPCYFGIERDPPCAPPLWTARRYAPEVIDSMAAALARFLAQHPHSRLVFLGHSGGGTLAVLLAERFKQTAAVVTIGANLDVARWTRLHGYTALTGSLDPRTRVPLPRRVLQRHYVGSRDTTVPPALARGYAERHPPAEVVEIAGYDHVCCWRERWPAILADLAERLAGP